MRRHRFPLRAASVAVALAVSVASCSHSSTRSAGPASPVAVPRTQVLVALGSSATFGDGLDRPLIDGWPQLLYHEALPRSTVFINASYRFVTVKAALAQQVPLALEQHVTVAVVWFGDADLAAGVPVGVFEAELDELVARLRRPGARVLLGNLPSGGDAKVAAYDDAIGRVARSRGATLVDIAAAFAGKHSVGPSSTIDPIASRVIARAFAAAFARS